MLSEKVTTDGEWYENTCVGGARLINYLEAFSNNSATIYSEPHNERFKGKGLGRCIAQHNTYTHSHTEKQKSSWDARGCTDKHTNHSA